VVDAASEISPSPRIAAMGSSRFQWGIVPSTIEAQLNLRQGDAANLGYQAATPQDFLKMYQARRSYFSNLDLLIVEVAAYHYNWNVIIDDGHVDQRFRYIAKLDDRVKIPGMENKIDYTIGYFSKFWDARNRFNSALHQRIDGVFDLASVETPVSVESNGELDIEPASSWTTDISGVRAIVHGYEFNNFKFSEYQLEAMTTLIKLAESDGVTVILMEPRLSPLFDMEVAASYAAEDRLWRDRIENTTNLKINNLEHSNPICLEWEKCYYDYGHMNPIGADSFTTSLSVFLADGEYLGQ